MVPKYVFILFTPLLAQYCWRSNHGNPRSLCDIQAMLLSIGGTPAVDFWVRLLEAEGEEDPKSDVEDNDDEMVGE